MKESRSFDALRQHPHNPTNHSPMLMSDEKWEKLLRDHDAALDAASLPRTLRQRLRDFGFGLILTVFFVGFGLIMGIPELRELLRHIVEQLFQNAR